VWFIALFLLISFLSYLPAVQAQDQHVKNIVIVHGAFADGSGWKGVFNNSTIENPVNPWGGFPLF
jgi:hypothetical protein